jgi:Beta-galactosidase trimerisation domain/Beta-galactosidase
MGLLNDHVEDDTEFCMKKIFSASLAILALVSIAQRGPLQGHAQEGGVGGSAFHKNDITYSTEVVTPHIPWATKLPGGPIRGFFITPIRYGRDMVELMQRLALHPTTDSIDPAWDVNCWGIGDYYGHETRGDRDDFQIVYSYVERDLTGDSPYEVMLSPGLNGWSRMTRPTRDAILRRVREGAGLVLIHPFVGDVKSHPFKGDEPVGDERIWDVSPLFGVPDNRVSERGYPEVNQEAVTRGKWKIAREHFITEGLTLDLLPEGNAGGAFYKYRANGDVLIKSGDHPVVAVKNYGKGRVVALAYLEQGFTPQSVDPIETKIYWDYWEYQYSLLARALLWAAGRETGVRVASLQSSDENPALKLTLASDTPRQVEIEVAGKNEFGERLGSLKFRKDLAAGQNLIEASADALRPAAGWPGGRQIFNVIIRDGQTGATLNWGAATFQTAQRAAMTMARPAADVYKRGETLSAVFGATGELSGLQMRMSLSDDLGRLLAVITEPARSERTFSVPLRNFIGKLVLATAELLDEKGVVIDQLRAKPVMVVQAERRAREYTALVSHGGTKHYLLDAQKRQVHAVAADTGFTWGGGVNNSLHIPRGSFGVYWYDRGPTTPEGMEKAIAEYQRAGDFKGLGYLTKKELYRRTGDKKFLWRTPSFNDPAFMGPLADSVRTTARNKARYQMDYYFVGDEGSLTSYGDPMDFDWSPPALDDFREWLKGGYRTLESLNREWKADFQSWEAVVPFTTEEAKKSGNFAPWADHRTFMEVTFARAYQVVRDAVVQGDPDAHIAVSGTQATNAYNGADWYRLDQVIDDFISYDGGNQWDMHRSFAKPHAMIGFWTGYGSRGTAVQNAIWTAAINNVLFPNIFWMYAFLDPDLTHSQSARDMGAAFKSLKFEGVGKLLMESERLQDGIAIHYSMPSVHGASILGYHHRGRNDDEGDETSDVRFPANRDGWVRVIKDSGLQFDFLSSEQLEKGSLVSGKYKVLILPLSMAVSPAEVKAIDTFVRNGGAVIADAAAGLMNEHCSWREGGLLNELFGIAAPASDKRGLKRARGGVTVTAEGAKWGLEAEGLAGLTAAEAEVRAAGGVALLRIANADAVIARRVGRGWAIYLNTLFDHYPRLRGKGFGGAEHRALVDRLLERAGVRPEIEIQTADGKQLAQAQVARYRFGDAEVLAVVKDNVAVEGIAGQDGVTIYNDAGLGRVARQEILIKLPRKYHVTDIRTGKQLGLTDVVRASIVIGDAVVLGLNRAEGTISLRGPASAGLGEEPEFTITSSLPGRRLVRCHIFGPNGSFIPAHAKNLLLQNASGSVVLPSALNDPAGEYAVRVTDVVTGATAEVRVRLN